MIGTAPDTVFEVSIAELRDGRVRTFDFLERGRFGHGLVFLRDGQVRAWRNLCPHWNTPLDAEDGEFFTPDEDELRCGTHDARLEPLTGECTAGPCEGTYLTPLPVDVVEGTVKVRAPRGVSLGGDTWTLRNLAKDPDE